MIPSCKQSSMLLSQSQDRPLGFAFDALNIVEKLIDDEHSYIKAKAYVAIAKVYL